MNISLALKHHELRQHQAQVLATIIRELHLDDPLPPITTSTAGGDHRRLRGIPVVGARGVGGTQAGSDPYRETARRETLRERGNR
jgi:ABC-type uncharacterized transport system substrate-binding protein